MPASESTGLMIKKRIYINPESPDDDLIRLAADKVRSGEVIVFPTWCLYGLAADAFNEAAVERVFQIKQRPADNPLLILIKNREMLESLVADVPESALRLMDRFWPGKLTIVFNARSTIPDILTAGTRKIGIRLPEHPVARALLDHLDRPVTGTSANISSSPGCSLIDEMDNPITEKCGIVIDSGKLKGGNGSTIVDVTIFPPHIIREGEVSSRDILRVCS